MMTFFVLSANSQSVMSPKKLSEYRCLYAIGEYERILGDLQANDFKVDFDLLLLSGNIFHKMGDYENAIQAYSQAMQLQDNAELLALRAAAYLDLGVMDLCIEDLNEAKRKLPDDPYLYFTMGNYSLDMGDMKNALKNYKKSIALNPDDEKVYFMMAVTYNEMGNFKRSIELFESLSNNFPQAKYNIAISYLQNDQPQVANELLDQLSTVYKDDSDFFFFRAESKFFQQDKSGACLDYKTAADLGDEEASSIYDKYCLQNKKKAKSSRINSGAVQF